MLTPRVFDCLLIIPSQRASGKDYRIVHPGYIKARAVTTAGVRSLLLLTIALFPHIALTGNITVGNVVVTRGGAGIRLTICNPVSKYNNIGWTYYDAGDYEQALATFQKATTSRREEGDPALARIALWAEARTLRSLGRVEEALALQQELLREFDALGEQDGYVYEEIAECLAALGRNDEAHPYFALAYKKLSADPWLAESEPARLERLRALGTAS
jgi:tetratricopeptide (TPR) repeat protein